jgi:5'-3' exonuclease
MILIDYSGISIAPIVMGQAKFNDDQLLRHMILNTIRMYRQKFKEYGEIVIVADGGGNWRKEVYPEYKFKRKGNREESKIDWDEAFRIINMVLQEIKDNMPYKVIHQWGCEADDSIAEIVKWTQEFGNHEKVMIVSADKDFKQLQKFDNVSQYSPITKKLIKVDNPRLELQEHILTGDAGDGVPNVLSDDKVFAEGRRQNILSAKKKEALLNDPESLGEEVYRNYLRNKKMIDITESSAMPDHIRKEIINNFETQNKSDYKKQVLNYFIKHQCRNLIEVLDEFIS